MNVGEEYKTTKVLVYPDKSYPKFTKVICLGWHGIDGVPFNDFMYFAFPDGTERIIEDESNLV